MGEEHSTTRGELVPVESEAYTHDIDELRSAIESTRQRITATLDGLQDEVEDQLDWKQWVDDHPWKTVGVAFAIGFYLGIR